MSTATTPSRAGRSYHHRPVTGAECTSAASMTSTGTPTKNNHESENTAVANSNTANGSRINASTAVERVHRFTISRGDGRSTSVGHAARTHTNVNAARNTTRARTSATK